MKLPRTSVLIRSAQFRALNCDCFDFVENRFERNESRRNNDNEEG